MSAFWTSWSTTVGLLAAIGAQNAFVIESAILKRNSIWVALTCILSDFVMITAGFLGLSVLIQARQGVQVWLAWVGIIFLVYYGGMKLRDSFKTQKLDHLKTTPMSIKSSVLKTVSFTWLNPHVYVDTVILIPALSLQFQDQTNRYMAAIGGYLGVVTWFVGITSLGTISSKLFQNAKSWKILNLVTAIIMFWVAIKLYRELT